MSPPAKSRSSATLKAGEQMNPFAPNMSGEMMGTLGEAGNAYFRGVVSLNREVANFINKRLEHDAEFSRALGKCKDWKEATELQQNWFREASEEYAANARTLMEMTTKLMNETWAPLRQYEDAESKSSSD